MTVEEAIALKKSGKKIEDSEWKKFSKQDKATIMKACGKGREDRNDWRYYAVNEQIAKDLANFPYNVMSGLSIEWPYFYKNGTAGEWSQGGNDAPMTSVMVLNYSNTPGYAIEKTSGVNMAATQLYTVVRKKNAGATNYEPADLMMFILAMREIYSDYAEDMRALRTVQLFDVTNRSLPDTILTALGIEPKDLRKNFAQYRGRLNLLGARINALAVPQYFKMFDRTIFVGINVFMDSDSRRGQYYAYVKNGYYQYSPKTSTKGGELQYKQYNTSATGATGLPISTFADRLDALESMLDAMFLDSDINTMNGDIVKQFDESKLYRVPYISENEVLVPAFNEDALAQIENSYSILSVSNTRGAVKGAFVPNVSQSEGLINFSINMNETNDTYYIVPTKLMFNSHKDDPTFMDNLEWSRLTCMPNPNRVTVGSTTGFILFDAFGQEVVWDYTIFWNGPAVNNKTVYSSRFTNTFLEEEAANTGAVSQNVLTLGKLAQFDWHPIVYVYNSVTLDTTIAGDIKKYTTLTHDTLKNIHDSAVFSSLWSDDIIGEAQS